MFIIFSGLPATGKTTISRELSRRMKAVYLRIDSLECALAGSGVMPLEQLGPGGYYAAAAVAVDNLRNGLDVVADSVNPWPDSRRIWLEAAKRAEAAAVKVEVICSDEDEHRQRVETRHSDIEGQTLPSWRDVLERGYVPWREADLCLDTAFLTPAAAVEKVLSHLSRMSVMS